MALRALDVLNVDIGILTEAKLTDGVYSRFSQGYTITATEATSHRQGGVALCFRENEYFQVEASVCHGPNVISCELVTGQRRVPLVGVYIPPADVSTLEHVRAALDRFADHPGNPILLGDLNVDLDRPEGEREEEIAVLLAHHSLMNMIPHFRQRAPNAGRKTWRQTRNGERVTARCDYIVSRDHRCFTTVGIRDPRHFSSDHLMVIGVLQSA
jgi:endonuclease/exonuclease/phosphatase family metal-dependent hydrolase